MTDSQIPPQIFDRALLKTRRVRAARREPVPFLMQRCVDDVVEKLLDINRTFSRTLIIAPAAAGRALVENIPAPKRPEQIRFGYFTNASEGLDFILDEETLPFDQAEYDLIISLLSLHAVNDLPGALIQFKKALIPDGVFIASMFGGDTLLELRQAMYKTDAELLGGMTPRIFPFADFQQLAGLLQRAGFALPVVDTDRVNVTYKTVSRLIADLRDMGETNILHQRDRSVLPGKYLESLAAHLKQVGEDDRIRTVFEILWLTGWAPDASQPKPLKPGSAQISLTKILGDKS